MQEKRIIKEKTKFLHLSAQMHNKRLQLKYLIILVKNYLFSEKIIINVTSEEAVSLNVYTTIARDRVNCYAYSYFR